MHVMESFSADSVHSRDILMHVKGTFSGDSSEISMHVECSSSDFKRHSNSC